MVTMNTLFDIEVTQYVKGSLSLRLTKLLRKSKNDSFNGNLEPIFDQQPYLFQNSYSTIQKMHRKRELRTFLVWEFPNLF